MSFYGTLQYDLAVLHVWLLGHRIGSKANDSLLVLNRTVDVCAFFQALERSTVAKTIYRNLAQDGKLPKTCPVRKGQYYIANAFINNDIFPPYMPEMKALIIATYLTSNGTHSLVPFARLEFFLDIRNKRSKKLSKSTKTSDHKMKTDRSKQ